MKKPMRREVRFDAMTMKSARDIIPTGPVFNLGDAPQRWRIHVRVITADAGGKTSHNFTFTPDQPVSLAMLHGVIADELSAAEYDRGRIVSIPVRAEIIG